MVKRTGTTNPHLKKLIRDLKKVSREEKVDIWKAVAFQLEASTRQRRNINLSKIDKYAKEQETLVVPGKVLGTGNTVKPITIAAFQFSASAKQKLGSKAISIPSLLQKNPKGKHVRILG